MNRCEEIGQEAAMVKIMHKTKKLALWQITAGFVFKALSCKNYLEFFDEIWSVGQPM